VHYQHWFNHTLLWGSLHRLTL